jgi:hypothetical protein
MPEDIKQKMLNDLNQIISRFFFLFMIKF